MFYVYVCEKTHRVILSAVDHGLKWQLGDEDVYDRDDSYIAPHQVVDITEGLICYAEDIN